MEEKKIRDIEPFCLCGNVYFVGSSAVSVHLIDTGDGLIMIDTGYPFMRDAILENIRLLGFDIRNVKMILHSHGHYDHYGNTQYFKQLSGAKTYISRIDNDILNGTLDLSWAVELGCGRIPSFSCDVLLEDGDIVSLGNTKIRCLLAPGHTAGVLCFFLDVEHDGRILHAAMHGGIGMGSMRREFLDRYNLGTTLREQFRRDVEKMVQIPVDVVLGNHPYQNRTEEKLVRVAAGERDVFIDSSEWARLMKTCADQYDAMLAEELEKGI